jgi:competence protein ComEC
VKVAHHGSRTSTTAGLLDAARPVIALVSVGADNRFGHPHPEVLARLAARGVTVLRTDRDGTITVDVEDGVITVRAPRTHTTLEVRCRPECG